MSPEISGHPIARPGARILMIGDSQVVGDYGKSMSKKLRLAGAEVFQYGVASSTPEWWMKGTVGRSGWSVRLNDVSQGPPGNTWKNPHSTPTLASLLEKHQPQTLIISMGGNLRGKSEVTIRKQVEDLLFIARGKVAEIIWVSSPERRADDRNRSDYEKFTALLRNAVGASARFIDSSKHSDYPQSETQGDGTHLVGAQAESWASAVMAELQSTEPNQTDRTA